MADSFGIRMGKAFDVAVAAAAEDLRGEVERFPAEATEGET
jgi:hypothetical protein